MAEQQQNQLRTKSLQTFMVLSVQAVKTGLRVLSNVQTIFRSWNLNIQGEYGACLLHEL